MDIKPEDETSYTTQYQETFLKYMGNEYCAKLLRLPVSTHESLLRSNLIPSETVVGSCQSSFDPYDLSSSDEEYLTPNNVAEMTPGWSNRAARSLTAATLYLNSPSEAPNNWVRINPILDDYHSDTLEICIKFWLPAITDWSRQQEEMHYKYTDLCNVACDIFSIIQHGVGVEASCSLRRDVIGLMQSKSTREALRDKVVVMLFARANDGILAASVPLLDTTNTENDSEMKIEAEERTLHRMAKVHNFWGCGRAAKTYVLRRRNLTL